jgi:dTDP-4-dehydrorhamnose 3,5-epimerase
VRVEALPGLVVVELERRADERGLVMETFQRRRHEALGVAIGLGFVQDNLSSSARGILRGLHLQHPHGQGKLVSVVVGEVFDVAVDVRHGSPTFGRSVGYTLSAENKRQLWIPPGFAHGFCVTSDRALFAYKCTELYRQEAELGVLWSDPDLGITWPISNPTLSKKDEAYPRLRDVPVDRLPTA